MGETELTHLVGGGILVVLVLDRVATILRVARQKHGNGLPPCQTMHHVEALAQATATSFAEVRDENKAIRGHLGDLTKAVAALVTGIAILQDRSHRDGS